MFQLRLIKKEFWISLKLNLLITYFYSYLFVECIKQKKLYVIFKLYILLINQICIIKLQLFDLS